VAIDQAGRGHAVVLGASMAGLLAARVLSESFERVTVIERDDLAEPGDRQGVPQGRHVHALLARGKQIFEELFPGFTAQLLADGAVECRSLTQMRMTIAGQTLRQADAGYSLLQAGRPFLEWRVRERVRALGNVAIEDRCSALGLLTDAGQRRVTGVRLESEQGGVREIDADLVVSCMGRHGPIEDWLEGLGYERPRADGVRIDMKYASRYVRLPAGAVADKEIVVANQNPARGLALFEVEDDRHILTLIGYGADHPPTDADGFWRFAASVAPPDVREALLDAEPLTPISTYRYLANQRRRYELLTRFPDGLLVMGDAVCSFSPAFGQGMSVSALQSLCLRRVLADSSAEALAARWFRAVAAEIDDAWMITRLFDLAMPHVDDGGRIPARALELATHTAMSVGARDAQVGRQIARIAGLLDKPGSVLDPLLLGRAAVALGAVGIATARHGLTTARSGLAAARNGLTAAREEVTAAHQGAPAGHVGFIAAAPVRSVVSMLPSAWRTLVDRPSRTDTRTLSTPAVFDPVPYGPGRGFHRLTVREVHRDTADSVIIEFDVPEQLSERFRYRAGQHVVIRGAGPQSSVRRTYSLCDAPDAGRLRIAVKRQEGGLFSAFAVDRLSSGTVLHVSEPAGTFTVESHPAGHYVAVAAGSGITPILALAGSLLATDPAATLTLHYGSRDDRNIMLRTQLDHLLARFADRLRIVHHLSRGNVYPADPGFRSGRITPDLIAAEDADHWLLCGPRKLVTDTVDALHARGITREAISFELFDTGHPTTPSVTDIDGPASAITLTGIGPDLHFDMPCSATILDAALHHREDLPYSCLGGSCGTCLATVESGAVELPDDPLLALTAAQRAAGRTLPCVARPLSEEVTLRFIDVEER